MIKGAPLITCFSENPHVSLSIWNKLFYYCAKWKINSKNRHCDLIKVIKSFTKLHFLLQNCTKALLLYPKCVCRRQWEIEINGFVRKIWINWLKQASTHFPLELLNSLLNINHPTSVLKFGCYNNPNRTHMLRHHKTLTSVTTFLLYSNLITLCIWIRRKKKKILCME